MNVIDCLHHAYHETGSYASTFALMAIPSAAGRMCVLMVGERQTQVHEIADAVSVSAAALLA